MIFLNKCHDHFHLVFPRYEAIIPTKCVLDFNLRIWHKVRIFPSVGLAVAQSCENQWVFMCIYVTAYT